LEEKIRQILSEKVDPVLASHFGGAELTAYEDGVVYVKLTGACGTCPSAQFTVEDVIRAEIVSALPEVKDVVLDTAVSEDLIDFAKKILNKEIQ
jgi:Fe-S cluster biogenesis protein NfuA